MTVLVTGASGTLGWCVAEILAARGAEVRGTSRDGKRIPSSARADALRLDDGGEAGAELVRSLRPSAVLHLAGLTRPDDCARDPAAAELINAAGTGALAQAAAEVGADFLFTSTDLVFDGSAAPYAETAAPRPLGPYMASKAEGERLVLGASPEHLVVRVPLLYGVSGSSVASFSASLIAKLRAGEEIRLFTDQFRTPVEVRDAAELLCDLLEVRAGGLVHLAGPERVSRHEHGLALARALGVDPALCVPLRMSELRDLSPRPADVSLVSERLQALVGRSPLSVSAGWARSLA